MNDKNINLVGNKSFLINFRILNGKKCMNTDLSSYHIYIYNNF